MSIIESYTANGIVYGILRTEELHPGVSLSMDERGRLLLMIMEEEDTTADNIILKKLIWKENVYGTRNRYTIHYKLRDDKKSNIDSIAAITPEMLEESTRAAIKEALDNYKKEDKAGGIISGYNFVIPLDK